jgi:hypothetical protein
MEVTITDVRKALEDMVYANLIVIYMIKHGEIECTAEAETSVGFSGDPYDNEDEYVINFYEALDVDLIDIRPALEVRGRTVNGFKIYTPRNTTVKWTAMRKLPKIEFWTP